MKASSYRVKFLDYEQVDGVTYYNISITDMNAQKATWFLKSRYSAMRRMHSQIIDNYSGELPNFPPKKLIGNLDQDFVSQRKKHLENYFNTLLRTINIDKIPVAKDFIFQGRGENEIHPSENSNINSNKTNDPSKKPELIEKNKEPAQTSLIKATGGVIEKVVDFYSNKMVDILQNNSFPEEEEVLKRKKIYEKFQGAKFQSNFIQNSFKLPKSHEGNVAFVKKESWIFNNSHYIMEIDKSIQGITKKFEEIEGEMSSKTIIHQIQ